MSTKFDYHILLVLLMALFLISCGEEGAEMKVTELSKKVSFNHVEGYLAKPPAIEGEYLFVAAGTGMVHKINLKTGTVEWTYKKSGGSINNTPIVTNEAVLIICSQGKLVAIGKNDGEMIWQKPDKGQTEWAVGKKTVKPPEVTGCFSYHQSSNTVVLAGKDGMVFGIDGTTGEVKWNKNYFEWIVAPPVFENEIAYLSTMGGRLHAINAHDGSDAWGIPKVLATGIEGNIEEPKNGEGEKAKPRYMLTVKYKYNFHRDDHFLSDESIGGSIEISLIDDENGKITLIDRNKETTLIPICGIKAEKHLDSGSHTIKKTVQLARPPVSENDWPVTVIIRDKQGNELHRLSGQVNFKKTEKNSGDDNTEV